MTCNNSEKTIAEVTEMIYDVLNQFNISNQTAIFILELIKAGILSEILNAEDDPDG